MKALLVQRKAVAGQVPTALGPAPVQSTVVQLWEIREWLMMPLKIDARRRFPRLSGRLEWTANHGAAAPYMGTCTLPVVDGKKKPRALRAIHAL